MSENGDRVNDHQDDLLVMEDVGKVFTVRGATLRALDGVRLSIREGEFVSILGQSGCGKSTLLKLTAGVMPSSEGEIRIAGKRVDGPFSDLGMVFQSPVLLEWRTVFANVMLPIEILGTDRTAGADRAGALLTMVGLAGFERLYPTELSGGMQQRVAICRALVTDPPLLLMDEPFGALDALTRDVMAAELLRIWDETRKTIVFVTHSIDEAVLLSDRVVVMTPRPGRVNRVVDIDLPRPRDVDVRYGPRFVELSQQLRDLIYQPSQERPI